ncbi:DNA primase [Mycoplasma sp. U97]|uniref:DNA primase n=1 Tax=Mycoplasma tauri TaxID=547987 RepID=UPI001CBC7592|nr:DNA primase [Mycoplasma tauri]MBZ4212514.1 DNA primase [Mycoplasma tauri]
MKLDKQTIDNIVSSNDIVDVLRDFIELYKKGNSYVSLCPFHEDTNPSMSVDSRKQIFKCFVCNTGGNCLKFLKLFKKWNHIESLKYLANKSGIFFDESKYKIQIENEKPLNEFDQKVYEIIERANSFYKSELFKSLNTNVKNFLSKRNLTYSNCQEFDIGYAPYNRFLEIFKDDLENNITALLVSSLITVNKEVFFKNRITFAIRDEKNKVVAFSARALDDSKPKYINSSESNYFKKSEILYNLNKVFELENNDEIIITEGFFDVIALNKSGIKNSVCLMGTSLSNSHINKLKKFKKITLFLDGDQPGMNSTYKIIRSLLASNYKNIYVVNNKMNNDPDEILQKFGKEKILNLLSDSAPYIHFIYDYLRKLHGLYDGIKNIIPSDGQFEKFGSEFYPFWKSLNHDLANAINQKIKTEHNKDMSMVVNKNNYLFVDHYKTDELINNDSKFYEWDDYLPYDNSYFDHHVSTQTFESENKYKKNKPFLNSSVSKPKTQNWIEKMFVLIAKFPNLVKLFKTNNINEPISKIAINDCDKNTQDLYEYVIENSKIETSKILEYYEKYNQNGKTNFIDSIGFNFLDNSKAETDFNEIYQRAYIESVNAENYHISKIIKDKMSAHKLKEELLEVQRKKIIKRNRKSYEGGNNE